MSYNPNRIHLYPNNTYAATLDKAKYGSYFHYMGVYSQIVDFRYSTQGSLNVAAAKDQKIGPVESSLLITDIEYVLVYKGYVQNYWGFIVEETINVQPQVRAGITIGGTQIHGDYNLDFNDRSNNYNVVGMGTRPDITSINKGSIVTKGSYVWVTNSSANDISQNPFLVNVLIRGFHFKEDANIL